jgi:tocopherol O-methyltransferase
MIDCPEISKSSIRSHYNLATPFYRLLWGEHIHHGLWEGDESTELAQEQLVQAMIARAAVQPGDAVLDVGCGMGGSSIYLARNADCTVTGVTISRVQRVWAAVTAWHRRVGSRARFRCADAEKVEFAPESFDVVWSIECTEHLFDKPRFFRRAAEWLRPGGRIAICAWLAGSDLSVPDREGQVRRVCEGMLCPSLGTGEDYCRWMEDAGLVRCSYDDWTDRVARTWEICLQRIEHARVRKLTKLVLRPRPKQEMVNFLDKFQTILDAYRTKAMQYGCIVFEKPATS